MGSPQESHMSPDQPKIKRPAKIPTHYKSLEDLLLQFGSEEGLVEAFLLHQLDESDMFFCSPTWMTCCLLRRVLEKMDVLLTVMRGEKEL